MYLAMIIDLFSLLVVDWAAMAERMMAGFVCEALQMAIWRRKMPKGVMLHSDRGSQYCSNAYHDFMEKHQVICSMSGKGDCDGNASAEDFFLGLKVEAIHKKTVRHWRRDAPHGVCIY